MFHLIYMSSAVRPFSVEELDALLAVARRNNTALGLTGMLVYKDSNFLQVLEGEQAAVEELYGKITKDPRHTGCTIFIQEPIVAREFADWSMGFRDLGGTRDPASEGFSGILQADRTDLSVFPTKVRAFMRIFVA